MAIELIKRILTPKSDPSQKKHFSFPKDALKTTETIKTSIKPLSPTSSKTIPSISYADPSTPYADYDPSASLTYDKRGSVNFSRLSISSASYPSPARSQELADLAIRCLSPSNSWLLNTNYPSPFRPQNLQNLAKLCLSPTEGAIYTGYQSPKGGMNSGTHKPYSSSPSQSSKQNTISAIEPVDSSEEDVELSPSNMSRADESESSSSTSAASLSSASAISSVSSSSSGMSKPPLHVTVDMEWPDKSPVSSDHTTNVLENLNSPYQSYK